MIVMSQITEGQNYDRRNIQPLQQGRFSVRS